MLRSAYPQRATLSLLTVLSSGQALIGADDGVCKFDIEPSEKDYTTRTELMNVAMSLVEACLRGNPIRGNYVEQIGTDA